jgi:hypothetical protein
MALFDERSKGLRCCFDDNLRHGNYSGVWKASFRFMDILREEDKPLFW